MKRLLFQCVLILFCHILLGQSGEERISLNGYWKFKSFIGDGSNSLDITPQAGDILIDNAQEEKIEVKGKWETSTEPERSSKMWGKNYLKRYFYSEEDSSYVRFKTNGVKNGYYQHFIYYPWAHHSATIVNVKHADGLHTWPFSQRNRASRWLNLGVFRVDNTNDCYVEFTSRTRRNGVSADVVMLRPISEEEYFAAQAEKTELRDLTYDDTQWLDLKVPGHFGMINAYANYSGKAWYRKELKIPEAWHKTSDERIRIRFEGVYHVARVFFNGQYLGVHQGGFTPFEFDITDHINFKDINILALEANNDYTVGATWNWGGIIRDVKLIKNKDARIKSQYIHAEPDLIAGTADYSIKVRVENNSDEAKTMNVVAKIIKGEILTSSTTHIKLAANSIGECELKGKLKAKHVKLWHFDRPELYILETSLTEGETLVHKKNERFGIRKFEATHSQMLLNGEPVRLLGFNRVSDHRYWGSSEPYELLKLDVDLMKTAGANFMRIMHGTQNKKLIELCDEKGILLFEEANVRDLRNPQFRHANYGMATVWIKEMIERDANHPCIVGWSVGNELDDHYKYVKMAYEYTKKLDPHRLALCVSNRGFWNNEDSTNTPLNYGDMIFQNIYQEDPGKVMDTLHARWPNKAMFFSEFGWANLSRFTDEGLDNDFTSLGRWYGYLRGQRPFTTGASIWTYNDYRSGYMQSLPSENRAWGMVNAWRTKRRSWYTHLKENSPVKDMSLKEIDLKRRKATVSFQVRDANDFPSYTLKDYTLKYTFKTIDGVLLYQDVINLPVLAPGYGKWESVIGWKKLKEKAYVLEAELVSSNGYTRASKKRYFDVPSQPVIQEIKTADSMLRVHFTKGFDAFEYYVRYSLGGIEKTSDKTIASYIDLDHLPVGEDVVVQLIACNGKGESKASEPMRAKAHGKILAPIIWDGFIADNKLVLGYSGAWEDETYMVRYGTSSDALTKTASSNARGMMTVPLTGEKSVYFQIKRSTTTTDSQWSEIVEAKDGKFRIYE